MKFPKWKMPKISKQTVKDLTTVVSVVATVAQVALREIERHARRIK